ncbi:MAG: hypothetical protein M1828_002983, partial [Chrysothrix sp. TS-e1954]
IEHGVINLKSQNRWWSRYLFYNFVGVEHMKFLEARRDGQAFLVIANKVNNANAITERQRSIDQIPAFDEDSSCGVDIKGIRHDDKRRCDNWYEDGKNGLGEEGVRFLNDSGFVLAYNYLSEDSYQDAENPYGKSIDALELVSGWRIQRLLWTIVVAIVSDFCIVAVATLLSDAISVGLAVGSYAVALCCLDCECNVCHGSAQRQHNGGAEAVQQTTPRRNRIIGDSQARDHPGSNHGSDTDKSSAEDSDNDVKCDVIVAFCEQAYSGGYENPWQTEGKTLFSST